MPRIALSLLATLGLLLGVASAASANSQVGAARYAIDSQPDFSNLQRTGQRHSYVILQVWRQNEAAAIKAANPNVKVLAYKNLSASIASAGPGGLISTGVSHAEADRDHPEWFLKNRAGERFTFKGFSYLWAMDLGDPGYQRRWADNVIADLRDGPWDGVFVDDTSPTIKHHYPPGEIESSMNTDAEYAAATESALATIAPRVRAAGFSFVPNFGTWGVNSEVVNGWLRYVDGAMDEKFLKWRTSTGEGYHPTWRWEAQLANLQTAQRQGKDFIAISHSDPDDAQAARYGYATTLLGTEGTASFGLHHDYSIETWFDFYSTRIGSPLGAAREDGDGVWRRHFENGLVLVNPGRSTREVSLGGTYSGSGLEDATEATLAPNTGLILSGRPDPAPAPQEGPSPAAPQPANPGPASSGPASSVPRSRSASTRVRIRRAGRRTVSVQISCEAACRHRLKIRGIGRKRHGGVGRMRLAGRVVGLKAGQRKLVSLRVSRRARSRFKRNRAVRVRAVSRVRAPGRNFLERSRRVRVS